MITLGFYPAEFVLEFMIKTGAHDCCLYERERWFYPWSLSEQEEKTDIIST